MDNEVGRKLASHTSPLICSLKRCLGVLNADDNENVLDKGLKKLQLQIINNHKDD